MCYFSDKYINHPTQSVLILICLSPIYSPVFRPEFIPCVIKKEK